MSQDAEPAGTDQPPPAVVEWGDDGSAARRPRAVPALRGLATDRRLVPGYAAVGAAALMLSLISVWQVTAIDPIGDGRIEPRQIPAGVADLGGWAAGYLPGLLLLAGAMVLLLHGPPAVRRPARLVALGTGGALLAMLAATVADLGDRSRLNGILQLALPTEQVQVTRGPGVWCAVVGVAAVTLAAHLAGRHLPGGQVGELRQDVSAGTGHPARDAAAPATAGDATAGDGGALDWSWRRPHDGASDEDEPPGTPLDLTVEPTSPFTRPVDGRDGPR